MDGWIVSKLNLCHAKPWGLSLADGHPGQAFRTHSLSLATALRPWRCLSRWLCTPFQKALLQVGSSAGCVECRCRLKTQGAPR